MAHAPSDNDAPRHAGMHPGIAVWDARYAATPDYIFGTGPSLFLTRQAHRFRPGMSVLAVADGEGRNGVWLARQGLDVLSVDGSEAALEKARQLASDQGVTLTTRQADLVSWDWGEAAFDAVAAIFIQFAGPRLRPVLFDRAWRSLKPGGLLLLQGYRPEQLVYKTGGPSDVDNLYTEDQLRTELAAFEILQLDSYDAELDEGAGHRGMSALIDVVARRPG